MLRTKQNKLFVVYFIIKQKKNIKKSFIKKNKIKFKKNPKNILEEIQIYQKPYESSGGLWF